MCPPYLSSCATYGINYGNFFQDEIIIFSLTISSLPQVTCLSWRDVVSWSSGYDSAHSGDLPRTTSSLFSSPSLLLSSLLADTSLLVEKPRGSPFPLFTVFLQLLCDRDLRKKGIIARTVGISLWYSKGLKRFDWRKAKVRCHHERREEGNEKVLQQT